MGDFFPSLRFQRGSLSFAELSSIFFFFIEMATTAFAISPSCATRITPRGIIRGDTPSLSSSSWHRRSTAVGGGLTIRCQAKDKPQDVEPGSTVNPAEGNQAKSTTIWDALAFSGPGPERINGRLAMVGFVSALAVEAARGEDLVAQLADGGVFWFIGAAALFSVASLVPLFRGVDAPERSSGFMTADAELLNGRFAMLGLVGLAFTEFLKGGPLV